MTKSRANIALTVFTVSVIAALLLAGCGGAAFAAATATPTATETPTITPTLPPTETPTIAPTATEKATATATEMPSPEEQAAQALTELGLTEKDYTVKRNEKGVLEVKNKAGKAILEIGEDAVVKYDVFYGVMVADKRGCQPSFYQHHKTGTNSPRDEDFEAFSGYMRLLFNTMVTKFGYPENNLMQTVSINHDKQCWGVLYSDAIGFYELNGEVSDVPLIHLTDKRKRDFLRTGK